MDFKLFCPGYTYRFSKCSKFGTPATAMATDTCLKFNVFGSSFIDRLLEVFNSYVLKKKSQ